jgi:uncharacterized protein (UPF0261 family)
MKKPIAVLGTFDTKGEEHQFVAQHIRQCGREVMLIDAGGFGESQIAADVTREQVAEAGGHDLAALQSAGDRGAMVAAMSESAAIILAQLVADDRIAGVISLGGTGGTAIGTAAMRALPLGFPKVMVSTVAAGNVAPYLGVKDIIMIPSIVDVAGLNRFSRAVFIRGTAAVCALADANETMPKETDAKPLIVASMFGNTTQAVEHARGILEAEGYEVLVFHATGTGGRTMESIIGSGLVCGVLDLTTTEWADELAGGVFAAGPDRLDAAARHGVPAIVTPGCLDMVNFGTPESVPAKYAGRNFYQHNPQVTLMRTTPDECAELGRILAEKVNASTGPVTVLLPLRAISIISAVGKPFHDPVADAALFNSIRENLRKDIPLIELDCKINDATFAEACVKALLTNMQAS